MNVFAVISEYNPFHNGHAYMLTQLRKAGATHIVAIMGGPFLQRGEPALFSKQLRARCALLNGADLVLELPCIWATAVNAARCSRLSSLRVQWTAVHTARI